MKTILTSVVVIGLALIGPVSYVAQKAAEPALAVRTAKVQRGDLSRTINACLEKLFEGKVAQVRMNPTKRQDAITYTVVVAADHFGNVLPEMSANLQFEIERHRNVLLIPNDAIASPTVAETQTATIDAIDPPTGEKTVSPAEPSRARSVAKLWKQRKANRHLWVKDGGGLVRPVEVQLGASNGLVTEILGSNVHEGMEVVLGEVCMKDGG